MIIVALQSVCLKLFTRTNSNNNERFSILYVARLHMHAPTQPSAFSPPQSKRARTAFSTSCTPVESQHPTVDAKPVYVA